MILFLRRGESLSLGSMFAQSMTDGLLSTKAHMRDCTSGHFRRQSAFTRVNKYVQATFGSLPSGAPLSESAHSPTQGELSEVSTLFPHVVLGLESQRECYFRLITFSELSFSPQSPAEQTLIIDSKK